MRFCFPVGVNLALPTATYNMQLPSWDLQHAGDIVHHTVNDVLGTKQTWTLVIDVSANLQWHICKTGCVFGVGGGCMCMCAF